MTQTTELTVRLPLLHDGQMAILNSPAKRKIIRAGRRFGKTYVAADIACEAFLAGKRILYTAPTGEQTERFWFLVKEFLSELFQNPAFSKNETEHLIERPGTTVRIRAKTAWNADTLRGDFADLLIFDEWQLTDENAWGLVGAPMLLDNDGDAIFIYTPPSLRSRSVSKAKNPQHAAQLFKRAQAEHDRAVAEGKQPRWQTFTGTSFDNPKISKVALMDITGDMTALAYRQEIMAEDIDEAPGSLWKRENIERNRVQQGPKKYSRIAVALDPSMTSGGDDAGIVVGGVGLFDYEYYVIADETIQGSPLDWGKKTVMAYINYEADYIVIEKNAGGEMLELTLENAKRELVNEGRIKDQAIRTVYVTATRSKQVRADPVSAMYERNIVHHIGSMPMLEDELCLWMPGDPSPNRLDALVWLITELSNRGDNSFAGADQVSDFASPWTEDGMRYNRRD